MDLPPRWPVDHDLISAATETLQAHERLNHKMKSKLKGKSHAEEALSSAASLLNELRTTKSRLEGTHFRFTPISLQAHERLNHKMKSKLKGKSHAEEALSSAASLLNELRTTKSRLEGTHFRFTPISLKNTDTLSQLKHITHSHTPSSLHETTKVKIADKLTEIFGGQVKKLVYVCMLTCPWFALAQTEVSAQSRNNLLYVIFVANDEQFFSLATPHERDLCETIDEGGFLFATEVRHFCSQLYQGNVRTVEALCSPPESIILSTQEWTAFASLLNPVSLLQKSFVEKCIGQAVGGVVKRKKVKGQQVMRDDASLTKFCDAFRLLCYVEQAQKGEAICPWTAGVQVFQELPGEPLSTDSAHSEILKLLHQGFEEGIVQKERLLQCVLEWKHRLLGTENKGVDDLPNRGPEWTEKMEQWLASVRLDGLQLSSKPAMSVSDQEKLTAFLVSMGITSVTPENILVVAEAGSHMYGLATPTSDTDYIIVFRQPTENIISSYRSPKESLDNRGQNMDEEMAAYEARMFSEMLLKGAVNIVEMVFTETENLFYASEDWKVLTAQRDSFMSEQVILQYIGFVKTHMNIIKKGKYAGKQREGKILYHIYHKLLSLEQFIEGHPPVIRCSGENREHIMRIRTGPLEGDLEPSLLLSIAEKRLENVIEQLQKRTVRLREFGDYRVLQTWLLHVRGVGLTRPLRYATPPPTGDLIT